MTTNDFVEYLVGKIQFNLNEFNTAKTSRGIDESALRYLDVATSISDVADTLLECDDLLISNVNRHYIEMCARRVFCTTWNIADSEELANVFHEQYAKRRNV